MYPRYSILPNAPLVFHDQPLCTLGNNVEQQHLAYGTGGRRRCKQCEDIGLRLGNVVETLADRLSRGPSEALLNAAHVHRGIGSNAAEVYGGAVDPARGIGGRYGLTADQVYGQSEPSYSVAPRAGLVSPGIGGRYRP